MIVVYSFLFSVVKYYKNRPRIARVILENKVALFSGHLVLYSYSVHLVHVLSGVHVPADVLNCLCLYVCSFVYDSIIN